MSVAKMKADIEARIKAAANAAKPAPKRKNNTVTRKNNAAKVPTMTVHVQNLAGQIETFNVKQDATVGELRIQAERLVEAPLDRVKLFVAVSSGHVTLDEDTRTLTSYGIENDSTVFVVVREIDPGTLIDTYRLSFMPSLICGADDELFFTNSATKYVDVRHISDTELRTIGKGWLEGENGDIQVMNDEIFVLNYTMREDFKTIHVFRTSDGEHLRQFDIRRISNHGKKLCISPNNEIFIRNNDDIPVISALNGTLLRTIPNVFSGEYNTAFCMLNGELFCYTFEGEDQLIKVYNPNDGTLSRTLKTNRHHAITLLGVENTLFVIYIDCIQVLRPSDGFLVHEIIKEDYIGGACVLDNKLFVTIPQKRQINVYQAGFDIPLSKRNIARRAMLEATMNKVNLNTIQPAPAMVVPIQQTPQNTHPDQLIARGDRRPPPPALRTYRTPPLPKSFVDEAFANTLEGQKQKQKPKKLSNVMNNFAKTRKALFIYNNDQRVRRIEKEGREALTLCDSLLQRINEKMVRLETGEMNVQTIGVLRTAVPRLHTYKKEIEDALSILTGNARREKDTLKMIEDTINKAAIQIETYRKALERTLKGGRRTQKKRRTTRK
jgi:hypothetical protein